MAPQIAKHREWTTNAEVFLASILDGIAQPVWVVDHEGAILFANPAAVAALGYETSPNCAVSQAGRRSLSRSWRG
jgi:PAS domain-containing protein